MTKQQHEKQKEISEELKGIIKSLKKKR